MIEIEADTSLERKTRKRAKKMKKKAKKQKKEIKKLKKTAKLFGSDEVSFIRKL